MSLLSRPKLIHWQRDALNGMSPSSSFYAKVVEAENHLTAYRHRCVYRRAWMLGNAAYGYAGTTTLAQFRFRSGHGVTGARVMLIMGRDNTGATATTPYASVAIGATTAGPFYYGQNPTASDDAPDDMILVADTIAISADTTYSCSITTSDYARVMAACIYEVGADTIDETTEWFNATIPQAGSAIFDAFQGRILQGLSEMHRHNAGSVANWSLINGAARTRMSATAANLVDNTSTGSPTAATPGFNLNLAYRATEGVATVAGELAAYASIPAGAGTVTLVDSGGSVVATATVNSATPGWFTGTCALPASLAKYDLQFAGDGTNQISVYAASFIEYES